VQENRKMVPTKIGSGKCASYRRGLAAQSSNPRFVRLRIEELNFVNARMGRIGGRRLDANRCSQLKNEDRIRLVAPLNALVSGTAGIDPSDHATGQRDAVGLVPKAWWPIG